MNTQKLGNGLIYFAGTILAAGSIVKFLAPPPPVAYMAYLGFDNEKLMLVALIEMVTAILFLIPSTRSLGLLLVSAYMGGAISAHIANHPLSTAPFAFLHFNENHHYLGTLEAQLILYCSWIGVWLRHPESRWGFLKHEHRSAPMISRESAVSGESRLPVARA